MNQNVTTTSTPTFADLTISDDLFVQDAAHIDALHVGTGTDTDPGDNNIKADGVITATGGFVTDTSGISFGNESLDYYDEGTWTPTVNDSGTISNVTNANYIRVGDVVHIWALLDNIQDVNNTSNDFYISGLPFSPSFPQVMGTVVLQGIDLSTARSNMTLYTNGSVMYIYETIHNANRNAIEWDQIADNDDIWLSGTYSVQ
jgi:hypothetical protein